MATFEIVEKGGITAPAGFKAAGVHAGFRKNPLRLDFALVVADEPAKTTGTFTQNKFCAAPVIFDREQLHAVDGKCGVAAIQAIAINSGNANAATGTDGLEVAKKSAELVAQGVGIDASQVLVSSTGVIGVPLPLEPFEDGIPVAVKKLSTEGGLDAARAIMTTDTRYKQVAVKIDGSELGLDGEFHIGGMVKGSGMIQPNMATMIAVITTDVPLADDVMTTLFRAAVDRSFNCVTVDSDTSTNDTAIFMSSGKGAEIALGTPACDEFKEALNYVCIELAKKIAVDGEGATRIVQVTVDGAKDDADALVAARAVANSPLVKTAIAGHDANWGRVAAALGKSGAEFKQENTDIDFLKMPVLRNGLPIPFDEDEALRRFEETQIDIDCNLGEGGGHAVIWTCDLTHDYISINADYRS
ncbi:MAG: bifunctional glutamate N-acetyltransferase/amino-acid acetyltransferase ArgJ [Phoenicibacter congonensis]|uniref:Arginine biosynthesis bifunctional protein ArgJ n=1 Tax=Phoenicibacter congonensis TaxID=1944646 RepID=A0AA43U9X6_9ACTN|nr:bifunctional glutamate N-acetyltransferase/amino-acid acetyltransferase ArgJ [Phoenicibacter congonensis]